MGPLHIRGLAYGTVTHTHARGLCPLGARGPSLCGSTHAPRALLVALSGACLWRPTYPSAERAGTALRTSVLYTLLLVAATGSIVVVIP